MAAGAQAERHGAAVIPPVAEAIVEAIIGDLSDRGGLDNAWASIDEDIQDEIREAWMGAVEGELKKRGITS